MAEPAPRQLLYSLVGFGLLFVLAVLIIASGWVVPVGVVGGLLGVWAIGVAFCLRRWRSIRTMIGVPVALLVLWVVVVIGGDALFGWTSG